MEPSRPVPTATRTRPTADGRLRRAGAVMAFEATTLAVASAVHLSGHVHGRSAPFNAQHAGIAEAIICVVLGAGAIAVLGRSQHARAVGAATTGFAVVGFIVGLNFTARGGDLPDIAYHVTMLPVLLALLVTLLRNDPTADGSRPGLGGR